MSEWAKSIGAAIIFIAGIWGYIETGTFGILVLTFFLVWAMIPYSKEE